MISLLFYYLALPFLAAFLVIRFIRKYGKLETPQDIASLYAERPIEAKWFRALRRDHQGLALLGDYEAHGEAVDRAYQARQEAAARGQRGAFLVLNDKAEVLEEVDS